MSLETTAVISASVREGSRPTASAGPIELGEPVIGAVGTALEARGDPIANFVEQAGQRDGPKRRIPREQDVLQGSARGVTRALDDLGGERLGARRAGRPRGVDVLGGEDGDVQPLSPPVGRERL
jgi:hypothetical protein